MAGRNNKATEANAALPKRGRPPSLDGEEKTAAAGEEALEKFEDLNWIDVRRPHEPDPREVDNMTDRLFKTVLARYGWEQHGGRFEHVGHHSRRAHGRRG